MIKAMILNYFTMGCLSMVLRTGIIFGAGLYTGVYIAQNYQIDKVDDPQALFEKAKAYVNSKLQDCDGKKK